MELKLRTITLSGKLYKLLIVPYGIETPDALHFTEDIRLLIVPYGIETQDLRPYVQGLQAFNRTLWN